MNDSVSFMEVPEMKESVRPARSKLWAIIRYGFGGLVLFALGGSTFISLKQVQLLSTEVEQLKTALQGAPDISPLKTQLVTVQQQFESLQLQQKGLAEKSVTDALHQQTGRLEQQLLEQMASVAEQRIELSAIHNQIQALAQYSASAPAVVNDTKTSSAIAEKKVRTKTRSPATAPFVLTGIERRGGIAFAAIAPQSATQLTEITLMEPGETRQGWTLLAITGQQAQFRVAGKTRTLTVR